MKKSYAFIFVLSLILLDQLLKFYIKLNYLPGETHAVLGNWFKLQFVENEGMAWGWKYGGDVGKLILTLFRLIAVIVGFFVVNHFFKKQYHTGLIICVCLVYAGAIGNLIDSMFYGLIFDATYNPDFYTQYSVHAHAFTGHGYAGLFYGKVVDMLYFPIIDAKFPNWLPLVGGEPFEFFSPVFNIADSCISVGVILIFIFQKKFFSSKK
ncbi:MAG: lipoprotein signal peptidase [Phycisphaerales bacterium]|nr:lipoprotein signal peptidase [Phycisphaerales bacterium]